MKKKEFYTLLTLVFLLSASAFHVSVKSQTQSKKSEIIHLNPLDYKKKTSKGIVLVDFWASWCSPCRKMNPALEELAIENKGLIVIAKIDVDKYEAFANEKKVDALPTIIIYKNGKEMERVIGGKTKDELKGVLDKYLQKK